MFTRLESGTLLLKISLAVSDHRLVLKIS